MMDIIIIMKNNEGSKMNEIIYPRIKKKIKMTTMSKKDFNLFFDISSSNESLSTILLK